jgi:tagatose-6-phosphate ketose/aldose isomerase
MTTLLDRDADHLAGHRRFIYCRGNRAAARGLALALSASLRRPTGPRIDSFLADALRQPGQRVILTGAGSSGFIAEMVADEINAQWPAEVRALHTTSLLTHPELYLQRDRPTLLVSFGRSGSSPESVAAVELVRAQVDDARFLDITCNADGALAQRGQGRSDTLSLLMPAASCDRAFAMTSSLSCMLLAALSVFDSAPWPQRIARLRDLAVHGEQALRAWDAPVAALAQSGCTRVIYLGSGPLEARRARPR